MNPHYLSKQFTVLKDVYLTGYTVSKEQKTTGGYGRLDLKLDTSLERSASQSSAPYSLQSSSMIHRIIEDESARVLKMTRKS